MSRKLTTFSAFAIGGAVLLAACGGSSESTATSTKRSRNAALTMNSAQGVLIKDIAASDDKAVLLTTDNVPLVSGMNYNNLTSYAPQIKGKTIAKLSTSYANSAVIDSNGVLYVGGYYPQYITLTLPAGATKWVDVSLSANLIMAVADNGKAVTAGRGGTYAIPSLAAGSTKFVATASGWFHHLLLDDAGKVYLSNSLGAGTTGVPALRPGATKFVKMAAAYGTSGLLDNLGNAYVFGGDLDGVKAPALSDLTNGGTKFVDIAVGQTHAVALDDAGNVYHFGQAFNRPFSIPAGTKIVKVSANGNWSMALDDKGITYEEKLDNNVWRGAWVQKTPALPIAAYGNTTVAIGEDGKLVQLGAGYAGALPQQTDLISLGAGPNHALGVTAAGTVRGWGNDGWGQVSQSVDKTDLVKVVGGPTWSAGVTRVGGLIGWGDKAPVNSGLDGGVVDVVAGANHTTVLTSSGTVMSWGSLQNQAPSDFMMFFMFSPSYVSRSYRAISAHGECSAAIGTPKFDATKSSYTTWGTCPDSVKNAPELKNAVKFAIGSYHGAAIMNDGSVVAWGDNSLGQTNVPAGLKNAIYIAAGDNHTVAVDTEGRVWAWGDNSQGQTSIPENLKLSTAELATKAANEAAAAKLAAETEAAAKAAAAAAAAVKSRTEEEAIKAQLAASLPPAATKVEIKILTEMIPDNLKFGAPVSGSGLNIKKAASLSADRALRMMKIKGAKKPSFVVAKQPAAYPCAVTKTTLTAKKPGYCSVTMSYTDAKGKKATTFLSLVITK